MKRKPCVINPKTGKLYTRHLWDSLAQTPLTYYVGAYGDHQVASWKMERRCRRCNAYDSWTM